MKEQRLFDFSDTGFFVLRTPALPFRELLDWKSRSRAALTSGPGVDSGDFEEIWKSAVVSLRDGLREICCRPEVILALFVASPSLQSGIEHWFRDPESKKGRQAERALVRYFSRMCARPTPFGLFSACSVGRMDPNIVTGSVLRLLPRERSRVCSRLDFDYLCALGDYLKREPAVAARLRYRPNSSLYRFGATSWRYVASRISDSGRKYEPMLVADSHDLRAVLECARSGATWAELLKAVIICEGVDELKARSYIQQLIDDDFLIADLSPPITSDSPLGDLISQTEELPIQETVVNTLRWARDELAALDQQGLGASPRSYVRIASRLETLPAKVDLSRLFQVDMIKPVEETVLTMDVVDELKRGVEVLRQLTRRAEPEALCSFRAAFAERYDRAVVSLLEALDEESGVGFGPSGHCPPLVRGLPVHDLSNGAAPPLDRMLLQKVLDCARQSGTELELDVSELPSDDTSPVLPDSFALTATLISRSATALKNGDFQLKLGGVWGPNGVRYLARFCHADVELERCVRQHLTLEEAHDPEAIYAEVVHLPEQGIANMLSRPVLRDYELVYLGRSGAHPDRQLPASDLLLGLEKGRFVL